MKSTTPVFAVIGRVNKGKSSIVSTLLEDDSVLIESAAGTTRESREYPVRVDGQVLVKLVDTPGFQQAPRALAWLREHEVSAANRREVIEHFLETYAGTEDYTDECRLLAPILQGAGILYVVDGAKPFRRNYEAEMEILRWTGQPRMALVNKIGNNDYLDKWRPALDQYFSIVREFNAQAVSFKDRIRLLESFRELHEPWRENLDQAISHLERDWDRRKRESAHIIASLLVHQLTFTRELILKRYEKPEDYKLSLEQDFHDALRKKEAEARKAIEMLYQHRRLEIIQTELQKPIFMQDLFSDTTWSMLGLSPKQLIGFGAVAGATFGGMMDAAVGGTSFMAGSLLGGLVGAGSAAFYSAQRLATIENVKNYIAGGQGLKIGPIKNDNFPWIVLDRALLHYHNVRDLTHARRERLDLRSSSEKSGIVTRFALADKKELSRLFTAIRKKASGDSSRYEKQLEQKIYRLIQDEQ